MTLDAPLLSVIIPVYNVALYLEQCLSSILSSGYPELEVIVVDDGSTDSSPSLCDTWAERDSRLRVIHQPNAGQSAARNRALSEMRGAYFTFADADDWVAPEAFGLGITYLEEHPESGEPEPPRTGGLRALRSHAGTSGDAVGQDIPYRPSGRTSLS